jgi:DNA-binding NarL/FixJ family response regulator
MAGQAMPRDDAIAMARVVLANVAASDTLSTALPEAAASQGLSPRELDVLRLIVEGLSDREIAERLFISPRTVMRHVAGIFNKLGVNSRTAAATWAVRRDIT